MHQLLFTIRQVRRSRRQAILFVLCVALSLTAITAFSGFARSVGRALLDDARSLHAADIIITSHDPVSPALSRQLDQLVRQGQATRAGYHEFYSVVRAADTDASVLSRLKVVEPGYPLYGTLTLASGRAFPAVLAPGSCVVEQPLLDRTGLKPGDRLKVGYTDLIIADVVTAEPDRSLNLFSFGPRIFIAAADLGALGLMAAGARIKRVVLLKVNREDQLPGLTRRLKQVAAIHETVDTYRTARSGIKRFVDNFLFFLKLVGLFILMVFGLGIQGTLAALLNERQRTIAIMKTVGATNGYITRHFIRIVLMLGALGTLLGIGAGAVVQHVLSWMLAPFLPSGLGHAISWSAVAEGLLLGLAVVALFSFLPLYRLTEMRPVMIFRRQSAAPPRQWPVYLSIALFLIFFFALVLWHMHDVRFGLYFVGGIAGLVLLAALVAQLALWGVKRWPLRQLAVRQAIKGLFRQGNATRSIVITLSVSLAVIFANLLIEKNLNATFVESYPPDAPNAFFVDIQPHQADPFLQAVGGTARLYPIVRARVTAIRGETIDPRAEREKRRDNFSRVFNLTYRHHLLADEVLIKGRHLFRNDWTEPQVSILDTVAGMRNMDVGDIIRFKIQGVPLTARIASIRSRTRASFSPFFYFVFQEKTLRQAPYTLFAALKIDAGQLGPLQNELVTRFPNISVIDMSQTIGLFARLMNRLSRIVRIFSFFSIAAGILILISAVFATRAERIVESVYYKILGARNRFVYTVFALENLLIGSLSGLMALGMAQAGAWWVCTVSLDVSYRPWLSASVLMIAITLLLVVGVGMVASREIMAKRPATYLREQPDG